ncbi:hypothetical protein DJ010_04155 [Nocardioides silvaticus]|uniref:Uncharacterized protein n=1 Tax=Nocardioides silvaticus TaxID=2201891 RepID=A0A316TLZ5_9ACTN|nr:hypothetical protein [Nocardioides silvaticus]PWN04808.1 hypothetical protein DJ010_04155 [Nocardioides silvaticus]
MLAATPLDLPAPALGGHTRPHDAGFEALDAALGRIRDIANLGIEALNQAGLGLRKLPEGSLEELLVLPLTGDYRRIRQNALATGQVRDALGTYADNATLLSLAASPRWDGEAAAAFLLRVNGHALAARGFGFLVAETAPLFDLVADGSERLAIEVEELVMELVEVGGRLVRKLLSRVAGPVGWATWAAELALKGFDAVTDIIEDIERVLRIVDRLLELKGEVTAWVEEQRERLSLLLELVDLARRELPAGGGGSW